MSPETGNDRFRAIVKLVNRAEMRLDSFYDGRQARPTLIITSNTDQYSKYCKGSEGAGCSLATPWGESFIVISPEGLDVDVISHEMSHIELSSRLGWYKTTREVPQWFNEGLALMLDRRFVANTNPALRYLDYMDEWLYYTGGGQFIRELDEIESLKDFFAGSQKENMLTYMTSGMEVSYWLAIIESSGFQEFLKLEKSGYSFEKGYLLAGMKNRNNNAVNLPRNPLRIDKPYAGKRKISEN